MHCRLTGSVETLGEATVLTRRYHDRKKLGNGTASWSRTKDLWFHKPAL